MFLALTRWFQHFLFLDVSWELLTWTVALVYLGRRCSPQCPHSDEFHFVHLSCESCSSRSLCLGKTLPQLFGGPHPHCSKYPEQGRGFILRERGPKWQNRSKFIVSKCSCWTLPLAVWVGCAALRRPWESLYRDERGKSWSELEESFLHQHFYFFLTLHSHKHDLSMSSREAYTLLGLYAFGFFYLVYMDYFISVDLLLEARFLDFANIVFWKVCSTGELFEAFLAVQPGFWYCSFPIIFPLAVDCLLAALDLEPCFAFLLHIGFPSACT